MDVTVSVIIPTVGRGSLFRAIDSCKGADEIIVAWDTAAGGEMPAGIPGVKLIGVRGSDHGYTPRTVAMKAATGTHLAFLDDDDIYLPGAIDLFRAHACDVPVIFRMDHYTHGVLWREPELRFGNVSTQMFVVPNQPDRLGEWAPHMPGLQEPGGDFTFLRGCVERMGAPVWREEIVAKLRPDRGPSITIVTPWRDHPELEPDYLAAVACRNATDRLVVIDNGSEPALTLESVRSETNLGFARASNVGLEIAVTDAVLFLNNDIAVFDRTWLNTIRAAVAPGVLVGAHLRTDQHGQVDGTPLPYLDGWCLAGMTDDLLELGGFDEAYAEPAYYSDNDLCLRARAAGMTLREVKVGLVHKLNQTANDDRFTVALASEANRQRFHQVARDLLGVAA